MATIRKRGRSYQIDYTDPTGKRVRQSFKKRKEAEQELAKRVSLIAENPRRYLEIAKVSRTTFDELLEKYQENFKHQRAYGTSKKYALKAEFSGQLLGNITYLQLETYRNRLRTIPTAQRKVRKAATVNRIMACLRHMFAKAVEWEMIERNPFDRGRSLQLKENNRRLRFLTEEEISRLLAECPDPNQRRKRDGQLIQSVQAAHLRDFVVIAINTGMRKGEILGLKWSQLKNGFIYLQKTKTDEARQIPINDDLAACFKDIKNRQGLGSHHVLPDSTGGHVADIKTSFKSALKRAGITDFRPHDLRHTFASHYMMRGGTLTALKDILGHRDIKMAMRYAHLSKEFAKEEIQIMNGLTSCQNKKAISAETAFASQGHCHKSGTSLTLATAP